MVRLVAVTTENQTQLNAKTCILQVLILMYLLFLVLRHPTSGQCVQIMSKV